MESLAGPQRQEALIKVGLLCDLRRRDFPEEDIATKLQFRSVEAMHTQLTNWGLVGLLPKQTEVTRTRLINV
jgi:hypothetical protein